MPFFTSISFIGFGGRGASVSSNGVTECWQGLDTAGVVTAGQGTFLWLVLLFQLNNLKIRKHSVMELGGNVMRLGYVALMWPVAMHPEAGLWFLVRIQWLRAHSFLMSTEVLCLTCTSVFIFCCYIAQHCFTEIHKHLTNCKCRPFLWGSCGKAVDNTIFLCREIVYSRFLLSGEEQVRSPPLWCFLLSLTSLHEMK